MPVYFLVKSIIGNSATGGGVDRDVFRRFNVELQKIKNLIKKILLILVSLLFLYNIVGFYFVFIQKQLAIKREVKKIILQKIPEDELELIKIPVNSNNKDFKWVEKDKEFRYKGKMYDIVKQKIVDGFIYFYCINDKKEESLFKYLAEHIKNIIDANAPLSEKNKNITKNIIIDIALISRYSYRIINSFFKVKFFQGISLYNSIFHKPLTPPPE